MRPIWSGSISFGLVTIPVKLYPATQDRRPRFRQLRESDHSLIRYRRVAEADGKEVPSEEIVRGYEVQKGQYVVFTEEELAASGDVAPKVVDVIHFVDGEEIDPIYYRSAYYLTPETTGLKAYRLMLRMLASKGKVAIAKVSLRDRVYLAALRPRENLLILETMHWPDEIRATDFGGESGEEEEMEIRPEEETMAEMLIDNLTSHFDPASWTDTRRETIDALAQQKIAGKEIVAPQEPEPAPVVDLMEALEASVKAIQKSKRQRKAG